MAEVVRDNLDSHLSSLGRTDLDIDDSYGLLGLIIYCRLAGDDLASLFILFHYIFEENLKLTRCFYKYVLFNLIIFQFSILIHKFLWIQVRCSLLTKVWL